MQLKRRVMDPRQPDEMSEALAFDTVPNPGAPDPGPPYRLVPQYVYNYYAKGLRARCYGSYSRELVGVTRFYPRTTPPIVIDFETAPPDPWFREEKLQFFLEQGIAYVPIYLQDVLTTEAFIERVEAAKRLANDAKLEALDLQTLGRIGTDVEDWMQAPALVASIDAEVLQELQAETAARGKPLFGAAKNFRLAFLKTRLIKQLREDMKRGRVVDPLQRHRELAPSAQ